MSPHGTRVLVLDEAAGQRLADDLNRAGYRFRHVANARYQARGEGVVATLYRSGKLVVQGAGLDSWLERHLGPVLAARATGRDRPPPGKAEVEPRNGNGRNGGLDPEEERRLASLPAAAIGSDEAGKGDTFGPLVVCALAAPEDGLAALREAGVWDSKRLTDQRVRVLAGWLRREYAHLERVIGPDEYNQLHREHGGNLNHLLAAVHAELVAELHRRTGLKAAIVDRFSATAPVGRLLRQSLPDLVVHELPRAEVHPAVAGASVLARDRFLENLQRLSEVMAVDLPRGSGSPVPPALRRFLEIHGPEQIGRVAKLHFKNVQAALERWSP